MDKLVIKKQKRRPNDNMYRVRVDGGAYDILEHLANETNRSMTDVCSQMIKFAFDRTVISEEEAR